LEVNLNEIDNKIRKNEIVFYETSFNFLNAHKSFRPGSIHTFLGKSGQGKSTLMRSILFHLILNCRVFLWLSEETLDNLQIGLFKREIPKHAVDNLTVFSEVDSNIIGNKKIIKAALNAYDESFSDIIIIDNITTSMAYGDVIQQQSQFVANLKSIASEYKIPIVVIAHTRFGIQDNKLIEDEDVRGFKKISNMSDYFYALQMFYTVDGKYQTLRILKSRYHDDAVGRFYQLVYEPKIKSYSHDKELNFLEFKEIFNRRNKL